MLKKFSTVYRMKRDEAVENSVGIVEKMFVFFQKNAENKRKMLKMRRKNGKEEIPKCKKIGCGKLFYPTSR
jgi:hypothetical protein